MGARLLIFMGGSIFATEVGTISSTDAFHCELNAARAMLQRFSQGRTGGACPAGSELRIERTQNGAPPEKVQMSLSRMEAKNPVVRESVFAIHHPQSQEPALNAAVQAQIGRRLRVMFDGETEPVPDRFQELLAQIDAQLRSQKEDR